MPIESYTVQLERVQLAIAKIEQGAQEYEVAGKAVKRADLAQLYLREKKLRILAQREARGGKIRVRRAKR